MLQPAAHTDLAHLCACWLVHSGDRLATGSASGDTQLWGLPRPVLHTTLCTLRRLRDNLLTDLACWLHNVHTY